MPMTLELDPGPGDDICETAVEMISAAHRFGVPVRVRFNGVLLTTRNRARPSQIVADYERWMDRLTAEPKDPGG